ncbi:MAG: hypothetical protein V3W34_06400 [Phycisphaerae bacterium]
MAEMMIAIIILGLGLLMVATMFPVAWTRARDLAEFTNQTTATQTAETTVRMLCNVTDPSQWVPPGGPPAPPPYVSTSFLGDFAIDIAGDTAVADTSVHVLHMENVLVETNDLTVPRAPTIWPEFLDDSVNTPVRPPPPLRMAYLISIDPTLDNWITALPPVQPPDVQIAFHERVIPALGPWPNDGGPRDAQWQQQLANRRFAWAVLHKLDAPLPMTGDETRSMTMYFVTLRRTQSTHRFARQIPAPANPNPITQPQALPPNEDMMFPVPWLINLQVVGTWPPQNPTGIPSEAVANPLENAASQLIAQMLQRGSVLIDRFNGNVYTVKQHRFTGANNYDHRATVTLDREITITDVDDGSGGGTADNGSVEMGSEDLRDFWVFPPPVVRIPGGDPSYPVFDGKQPVVGIETRQMVFTP